MIVASEDCIRVRDLPRNIQEENIVSIADHHPASSFECQIRDFKVKLATLAVRENNGNKTLAARSLNISAGSFASPDPSRRRRTARRAGYD